MGILHVQMKRVSSLEILIFRHIGMQELKTPNEFFMIFLTEKFLNQVVEETIYTIAYRRIQVSHLNSLFGIYENVSEFV